MNIVLLLSACGWVLAQLLKVIIILLTQRRLDLRYLMGSGGMPSSHSAVVCACASSTGYLCGLDSVAFAILVVFAFIVMYDAANVRYESGEQAKVLNYMMDTWKEMKPDWMSKELKELLGHTPTQVLAGALLGIAVGCIGCYLLT